MSDDWVSVAEAARRARRSKRRIYAWIGGGLVRTMRPARLLWVYLPDVIRVEGEQRVGRPRKDDG
jgi:hypothetical protein